MLQLKIWRLKKLKVFNSLKLLSVVTIKILIDILAEILKEVLTEILIKIFIKILAEILKIKASLIISNIR